MGSCSSVRRPCGDGVGARNPMKSTAEFYCFGCSTTTVMPLLVENYSTSKFIFRFYKNIKIVNKNGRELIILV